MLAAVDASDTVRVEAKKIHSLDNNDNSECAAFLSNKRLKRETLDQLYESKATQKIRFSDNFSGRDLRLIEV